MESSRELHYRYFVSYLASIIILLIALAYYDVPNLVDKFSFALTLSSLLLAVLAIFYTIISAQKQDLQLSKLVATNANLDTTAHAIASAAEDIRLFAREAPHHFQTIGLKLDSITANYGTLKSSQMPEVEGNGSVDAPVIEIGDIQFFNMFVKLQFTAMAVLYLFERSLRRGKFIEPETCELLGISSFDYAAGILNGLEVAGILESKIHKGTIVPVSCLPVVTEKIKDALLSVKKVADEGSVERLTKMTAAIDAYVA